MSISLSIHSCFCSLTSVLIWGLEPEVESTLPFLFLALLEQYLREERIKRKGKDSFVSAFSYFFGRLYKISVLCMADVF